LLGEAGHTIKEQVNVVMTKAEMEYDRAEYFAWIAKARAEQQKYLFSEAIESAMSSWDHIDGMMQYERKYEGRDVFTIEGIEIVLQYAPLLFDFTRLDKLELLLKTQRRIAKNASDDLANKISEAKLLMWEAHRLWDHLERQSIVRQDELRRELGGGLDGWWFISETWEAIGLIRRVPEGGSYRLAFSTQMDMPTLAKCPSCGAVVRAPKTRFLDEVVCPKCQAEDYFVILSRESIVSR
jgi:hypothetical protein